MVLDANLPALQAADRLNDAEYVSALDDEGFFDLVLLATGSQKTAARTVGDRIEARQRRQQEQEAGE